MNVQPPVLPSYFELRHLGFVNWYLFSNEDIPVQGRVALVGPNGSGKSSIIDGIQTVLTGNSQRWLKLNASAQKDGKSQRKVRDYCLGTLDDAAMSDETGVSVLRQEAISYILLGFRRTDTGQETTVGMCLSATREAADANVEAMFIVDGRILGTSHFIDSGSDEDGEWIEARPWRTVRAKLEAEPDLDIITESNATAFVKSIMVILGPKHAPMDYNRFVNNLKNAVSFKEASNPTDFVRSFILDAPEVNVASLRDSINTYRAIQSKLQELRKRIEQAEDLKRSFDRARLQYRTVVRQSYAVRHARMLLASQAVREEEGQHRLLRNTLAEHDEKLGEQGLLKVRAEHEVERLTQLVAQSDPERQRAATRQELDLLGSHRDILAHSLVPISRALADARALSPLVTHLNKGLADLLAALPVAAAAHDLLAGREALTDHLVGELTSLLAKVVRLTSTASGEVEATRKEMDELRENISRASAGKAILSGPTLTLIRLLRDRNIDAIPICEFVTSLEEHWRDAIEAILGDRREALVVAPGRYEEALRHYRGSGLTDGLVINTTKTEETRPPREKTLATVIVAEDRHARAFLDFALGNIRMVETEGELRQFDPAVTADLMYAAGRTTRRMRAPRYRIMGISAAYAADGLRGRLEDLQAILAKQEGRLENLQRLHGRINNLTERIADAFAVDVATARTQLDELDGRQIALAERLRILDEQGAGLRQELERAKRESTAVADELVRLNRLHARTETEIRDAEGRISTKKNEMRQHARDLGAMLLDDKRGLFDRFDLQEQWDSFFEDVPFERVEQFDFDPVRLGEVVADGEYRIEHTTRRLAESFFNTFYGLFQRYLLDNDIPRPGFLDKEEDRDHDEAGAWVFEELRVLQGNELVSYQNKAKAAYEAARKHFMSDFVAKMRDAFNGIDKKFRDLNKQLGRRDFHGLYYKFSRKPNPVYEDMATLIDAADDPEFEKRMFSLGEDEDPRVARAMKRLEEIAMDPEATMSDISDPKRYFEYDIVMLDQDGVPKTDLSRRVHTASGGQIQAPYYVAIAAGLHAACYPDRKGVDGGIALALFDEAFNRMDQASIGNCVEFMRDIGLQVFLAAPDEKRVMFSQMIDTMISISRNFDQIAVEVQVVKPFTHEQFRRENPRLKGFRAFREDMMVSQAGEP